MNEEMTQDWRCSADWRGTSPLTTGELESWRSIKSGNSRLNYNCPVLLDEVGGSIERRMRRGCRDYSTFLGREAAG